MARKLLADDGAAVIERERPAAYAFAHLHETLQLLSVLSAHQLQAMLGAAIGSASNLVLGGNPCKFLAIRAHRIRDRILGLLAGFVGIHAHDGVEAIHLAVLLIDEVFAEIVIGALGELEIFFVLEDAVSGCKGPHQAGVEHKALGAPLDGHALARHDTVKASVFSVFSVLSVLLFPISDHLSNSS